MALKHEGCVTAYFPDRGFGFIASTAPGNTTTFFFHISRITSGTPRVGAAALFSILPVREGKNPSAVDVEIFDGVTAEVKPSSEVRP